MLTQAMCHRVALPGISRLKPIKGDSVTTAVCVKLVEFVVAFQHSEGSIVWWLEAFAHCVPVDEDMCTGLQVGADIRTGVGMR